MRAGGGGFHAANAPLQSTQGTKFSRVANNLAFRRYARELKAKAATAAASE